MADANTSMNANQSDDEKGSQNDLFDPNFAINITDSDMTKKKNSPLETSMEKNMEARVE